MNNKWMMVMVLTGLFTLSAAAQQKPLSREHHGDKMFAQLDADKDGKISKAEADKEAKGKIKENFAAIDANKDNFVDKAELKAYRDEKKAANKAEKQAKQ
jgi:Ca2+-binding EF-hand superfamily protein